MKKKLLSLVTPLAFIATLGLGACSGGALGPADTDKLDVNVKTRGVTISFWTGFGSKVNEKLTPILDEFQAKTGITVEYESKGGYSNLQTAINLSATKGEYANVAVGYPDHFAGYINSNIQLRLDGLIQNDSKRKVVGKDDNGFDVDEDGIALLNYDDFYAEYKEENENLEFNEEGVGYKLALPFNKSSEVMVYNSNFFEWAATQNDIKDTIFVPKTWAEVKSVGLAIKSFFSTKGIYGKIMYSDGNFYSKPEDAPEGVKQVLDMSLVESEADFHLLSYDSTENLFITLVRQFGGTYTELDKTQTGKGYAAFNDEAYRAKTLEAMDMYRDLANNGLVGVPATYGESLYCSTPFLNCKSLLNVGSTGGLTNVVGSGFTTKAAPIPQNEKDTEHKFVISQGTNLALFNKGTEAQKVAAWKLMVYLSQQANGLFAAGTGYFPTCKAAYDSEEYQEYLTKGFSGDELLKQEAAKINSTTYADKEAGWLRFVDPAFRGSSSVRQEVGYIPGYIISGEIGDNQAILNDVYSKIRDYVRS